MGLPSTKGDGGSCTGGGLPDLKSCRCFTEKGVALKELNYTWNSHGHTPALLRPRPCCSCSEMILGHVGWTLHVAINEIKAIVLQITCANYSVSILHPATQWIYSYSQGGY